MSFSMTKKYIQHCKKRKNRLYLRYLINIMYNTFLSKTLIS